MSNALVPVFAHINTERSHIIHPPPSHSVQILFIHKNLVLRLMQQWSKMHSTHNGLLLHENNSTFNFSQQNAKKNQFSTQNATLSFPVCYGLQDEYLKIIIFATTWASLCQRIFGLVQRFFCPSLQPRCSSLVKTPGHGWSCNIAIQRVFIATLNIGHYLFTDSSRLIWKRAVENYESSPWLTWHTLSKISPLKLLWAILDVAAVLLKVC